jgi:hypothetical protein
MSRTSGLLHVRAWPWLCTDCPDWGNVCIAAANQRYLLTVTFTGGPALSAPAAASTASMGARVSIFLD